MKRWLSVVVVVCLVIFAAPASLAADASAQKKLAVAQGTVETSEAVVSYSTKVILWMQPDVSAPAQVSFGPCQMGGMIDLQPGGSFVLFDFARKVLCGDEVFRLIDAPAGVNASTGLSVSIKDKATGAVTRTSMTIPAFSTYVAKGHPATVRPIWNDPTDTVTDEVSGATREGEHTYVTFVGPQNGVARLEFKHADGSPVLDEFGLPARENVDLRPPVTQHRVRTALGRGGSIEVKAGQFGFELFTAPSDPVYFFVTISTAGNGNAWVPPSD